MFLGLGGQKVSTTSCILAVYLRLPLKIQQGNPMNSLSLSISPHNHIYRLNKHDNNTHSQVRLSDFPFCYHLYQREASIKLSVCWLVAKKYPNPAMPLHAKKQFGYCFLIFTFSFRYCHWFVPTHVSIWKMEMYFSFPIYFILFKL